MKKEFREKFRKLRVYIIYLFGSKAKGREAPLSDIDIGVVLNKTLLSGDNRDLYNICYHKTWPLLDTGKGVWTHAFAG
jgi:predicted nucleotidyltransferase